METQGIVNSQGGSSYRPPSRGLAGPKQLMDLFQAISGGTVLGTGTSPTLCSFHREGIVKITAASAGGGFYTGKLAGLPTKLPDPTTDASEDNLGPLASDDNAVFLNIAEIGLATHDLNPGAFVEGRILFETDAPQTFYLYGNVGSALPRPTEKYQVLQPVDDMLKPIWTRLRVQG